MSLKNIKNDVIKTLCYGLSIMFLLFVFIIGMISIFKIFPNEFNDNDTFNDNFWEDCISNAVVNHKPEIIDTIIRTRKECII